MSALSTYRDIERERWPDHEWRREVLGEWIEPELPFRNRVYEAVGAILNRGHLGLREYMPLFERIEEPRGDRHPDSRRVHRAAMRIAADILRIERRHVPWDENHYMEPVFMGPDW